MEVCFDERRKAFVYSGVLLRGVRKSLEKNIWPNFQIWKATRSKDRENAATCAYRYEPIRQRIDKYKRPLQIAGKRSQRRDSSSSGKRRGVLVDRQMERLLHGPITATGRTSASHDTSNLIEFLRAQGYEPVKAQQCVGLPSLRAGTAIDLIAKHIATGKLAAFEIKTGYERYWDRGHGNMRYPYHDVLNSEKNKAQIQLALSVWLAKHPLAAGGPRSYSFAAVIHVTTNHITMYPLENWAWNRAGEAAKVSFA